MPGGIGGTPEITTGKLLTSLLLLLPLLVLLLLVVVVVVRGPPSLMEECWRCCCRLRDNEDGGLEGLGWFCRLFEDDDSMSDEEVTIVVPGMAGMVGSEERDDNVQIALELFAVVTIEEAVAAATLVRADVNAVESAAPDKEMRLGRVPGRGGSRVIPTLFPFVDEFPVLGPLLSLLLPTFTTAADLPSDLDIDIDVPAGGERSDEESSSSNCGIPPPFFETIVGNPNECSLLLFGLFTIIQLGGRNDE
mmetsp:Transcript_13676/g.19106  ORF Transcript_13676/g.19106 Transcript_13676/m.19106 type:complete len:249 (-) Transcript_13676:295-1041(-)